MKEATDHGDMPANKFACAGFFLVYHAVINLGKMELLFLKWKKKEKYQRKKMLVDVSKSPFGVVVGGSAED